MKMGPKLWLALWEELRRSLFQVQPLLFPGRQRRRGKGLVAEELFNVGEGVGEGRSLTLSDGSLPTP